VLSALGGFGGSVWIWVCLMMGRRWNVQGGGSYMV
jgi:hypothetical protein